MALGAERRLAVFESPGCLPPGLDDDTLKTIALLICDPGLWKRHCFTEAEFAEFSRIISHCLQAVERVAGCEWMIDPLVDIQKSVEANQMFNLILRGVFL